MNVQAAAHDIVYPERVDTNAFAAERRARIEERRAFHQGSAPAFSGSAGLRGRRRLINLEPIGGVSRCSDAADDAAIAAVDDHRGRIINLKV